MQYLSIASLSPILKTVKLESDNYSAMQIAQQQLRERRQNRFAVGHEIQVRGLNYHIASRELQEGAVITFRREPNNPNDSNAVQAIDCQGQCIGYVAREIALLLSQFLIKGGELEAVFDGKVYAGCYNGFTNTRVVKSTYGK